MAGGAAAEPLGALPPQAALQLIPMRDSSRRRQRFFPPVKC
jgi:hypothetical protein